MVSLCLSSIVYRQKLSMSRSIIEWFFYAHTPSHRQGFGLPISYIISLSLSLSLSLCVSLCVGVWVCVCVCVGVCVCVCVLLCVWVITVCIMELTGHGSMPVLHAPDPRQYCFTELH